MSDRYFPIASDTACRLKWAWSTLYLNGGRTGSCHRASITQLTESNFDSFHNTPTKQLARQKMLAGEWPGDGCEYCRDIEQSGGVSDRMFQLKIPNMHPPELDQDAKSVTVSPTVLEVSFSNTCNFKCVYCKASLSSSILAEQERWGSPIIPHVITRDQFQYKNLISKFWEWLEKHSGSLRRLQILGGEPLLQSDFDLIMDHFVNHPNPELELNFVTNLHVPVGILEKTQQKLSQLLKTSSVARVDIQVSVDCWGPGQEYVRHGFDRDIFEKNLAIITREKNFRIGLLSTVNSLTINEMPDLAVKLQEWNQWQTIHWYMHLVLPNESSPFSPLIFDPEFFKPALEATKIHLRCDEWDQQQTFDIFCGIQNKIQQLSQQDSSRQRLLVDILDEIDRRRTLSWRTTFPWLATEIDHVV